MVVNFEAKKLKINVRDGHQQPGKSGISKITMNEKRKRKRDQKQHKRRGNQLAHCGHCFVFPVDKNLPVTVLVKLTPEVAHVSTHVIFQADLVAIIDLASCFGDAEIKIIVLVTHQVFVK